MDFANNTYKAGLVLYNIAFIAIYSQAVGLYPTNNVETNKYILEDCKANILVVEDEKMAKSILPHMGELPHLKKIVQWTGSSSSLNSDVITWDDVMKM